MKKVFLPVSLALLAGISVSCSTTEYKKYAGDEAKQVASILRKWLYGMSCSKCPASFLWKCPDHRLCCKSRHDGRSTLC